MYRVRRNVVEMTKLIRCESGFLARGETTSRSFLPLLNDVRYEDGGVVRGDDVLVA
jgi:hypothetical protein